MMRSSLVISVAFLTMLCACSVGETYEKPDAAQVKAWKNAPDGTAKNAGEVNPSWWRSLHDPVLDRLISQASKDSLDLKIAQARLAEAKALTGRASAALLPNIGLNGSLAQEGGQGSRGGLDNANTRSEAGISGSWTLDLFGSLRSEVEASEANLGNAQATLRQAAQALIADVARSYVDVRAQQQLLRLTEKNLALQNETLRATRIQYESKAAAKLDVVRAQAQASNTEAETHVIRANLKAKQHRIAVLMGKPPQEIDRMLVQGGKVPSFADDIVLQTPVWTIANRPDIQAAEFRLKEQAALKNARTADLFPKLSLSEFFGMGTASLYSSATPWSLGANIVSPLLNFGRLESEIDVADARKAQALHRYRKTVLEALEEVENALAQYAAQRGRLASLEKSAASQQEAVRMARLKYEAGDAVFIDVLIAEERLLQAESGVVQAKAAATRVAVDLYTAMGIVAPVPVEAPVERDAS